MNLKQAKTILNLYQIKVNNDKAIVIPEEYRDIYTSKDFDKQLCEAINVVLKELAYKDNSIVKPIQ